ncbi:hypothetical protein R8510_05008 [Ralstonia chuxiongensis]|nr:hypothetical protein R8510_05008 [Ralstonia chuxiongensis]
MCHALLQTPAFYALLRRIDEDLARLVRDRGCCHCGKPLHSADYPRKPRGCPSAARSDCDTRLSLCCAACRKRATPGLVRFLGRRVYLAIILVLRSGRTQCGCLDSLPDISWPTLKRWRQWWGEDFTNTPAGRWLRGLIPSTSEPLAYPAACCKRSSMTRSVSAWCLHCGCCWPRSDRTGRWPCWKRGDPQSLSIALHSSGP